MNYDCVVIFHKTTSLTPYFCANEHKLVGHLNIEDRDYEKRYDRIADRYTREQDVRLVLLVRYDYNTDNHKVKTYCKINCPISPLPVKGEFEAPSFNAVKFFLTENGWTETECLISDLLK